MKHLLIWQKLALIALALLLPFFLGVFSLVREKNIAIDFATRERAGVECVRPLIRLFAAIPLYEQAARGRRDDGGMRKGLQDTIDESLALLGRLDRRDRLRLRTEGATLKSEWLAMKALVAARKDCGDQAQAVRRQLLNFKRSLLNNSNLILDPQLDTYYLMNAALNLAPDAAEQLADLRAHADGPHDSSRQRVVVALLHGKLQELMENLDQALLANPALAERLGPARANAHVKTEAFVSLVLETPASPRAPARAFALYQAYSAASAATFTLAEATTAELARLLTGRIARQNRDKAMTLGMLMTILSLSVGLIFHIMRSITRPLEAAVTMANQLAMGHLGTRIEGVSRDEIGQLLSAMNRMGDSLRESEHIKQQQIQALKHIDAIKDDFLNVLSHELQHPLSILFVSGKLLQTEKLGSLNEKQAHHLAKMLKGASILSHLIRDLLDMSHIQAGKFRVIPRAIPPATVIGDLVDHMGPLAESQGLSLVKEIPPDLPLIQADEQRLGQVLVNLLNNAIKFSPEGGAITVTARAQERELWVEVIDQGIGIDAPDLPRVFERFVRLEHPHVPQKAGTGLGLSICQAIVAAHGGAIGCRSELGVGSTFWFTVPLARGD